MKRATITETKNRLSAILDWVRAGETVLVLDRGRPIARIESAATGPEAARGRLARLERQGLVKRASASHEAALDVLRSKPSRPEGGRGALAALLEERAEGR